MCVVADTPAPIRKPPPPSSKDWGRQPPGQAIAVEAPAQLAPTFKTTIESWMIPVVVRAIGQGLPLAQCGGLIGVSKRTFNRWLMLGQEEKGVDPVLTEFAVAVEEARSVAALKGVKLMNMHAAVDWKAQLEILRAQDPAVWSAQTRSQVEVTHHDGAGKEDLSMLTDEELETRGRIEEKVRQKRLPA